MKWSVTYNVSGVDIFFQKKKQEKGQVNGVRSCNHTLVVMGEAEGEKLTRV